MRKSLNTQIPRKLKKNTTCAIVQCKFKRRMRLLNSDFKRVHNVAVCSKVYKNKVL